MKRFLSPQKIQQLSDYCNTYLTPEIKKELLRIEKLLNIDLKDKQTNMNVFYWWVLENHKDETVRRNNADTIQIKYLIDAHKAGKQEDPFILNETYRNLVMKFYQKEFKLLKDFDINKFNSDLNQILRYDEMSVGNLKFKFTFDELLGVDDYYNYFSYMFGERSLTKDELKVTNKIIKFLDDLSAGVDNKHLLFDGMMTYLKTGDKSKLHNTLF